MKLNYPKAVLFDHDGVLVSSEEIHARAWSMLIKELGLPWDKIQMHKLVGRTSPQIMAMILDEFKPGWTTHDYNLDALALRKNDFYLDIASSELAAYPGVREGLEWLKSKGIKTAVVSNAKKRELSFSIERLKLTSLLDVIVSRDDAAHPKPHPAPYQLGAALLGLDPNQCLAIDDTPTGLESAFLAGCQCASVTTNYEAHHLKKPVPGRDDFVTQWVGDSMVDFFNWLQNK